MVLTTDGNDNPLTGAAALRLRQDGVGVFVVGLGKNLDPNVLRNISGDSNQVYVVPSVQRLSTVVRDVITDIGDDRKGICNIYTKIKSLQHVVSDIETRVEGETCISDATQTQM